MIQVCNHTMILHISGSALNRGDAHAGRISAHMLGHILDYRAGQTSATHPNEESRGISQDNLNEDKPLERPPDFRKLGHRPLQSKHLEEILSSVLPPRPQAQDGAEKNGQRRYQARVGDGLTQQNRGEGKDRERLDEL